MTIPSESTTGTALIPLSEKICTTSNTEVSKVAVARGKYRSFSVGAKLDRALTGSTESNGVEAVNPASLVKDLERFLGVEGMAVGVFSPSDFPLDSAASEASKAAATNSGIEGEGITGGKSVEGRIGEGAVETGWEARIGL